MCVFEEQQEFTGSCKAVGPEDWPPAAGASLGRVRNEHGLLPCHGVEGWGEGRRRGLEDRREDPRGGFKGQSSVPAWPRSQGLCPLPGAASSSQHRACQAGLETVQWVSGTYVPGG